MKRFSLLFGCVAILSVPAIVMIQAKSRNVVRPIAAAQTEARLETELITVRRFGFDPPAIKRPAGDFQFFITNRSQSRELALTLSRVEGNRPSDKVKDVGFRKGQVKWVERFNLPPGDYVLTEASHPDWKCTITLTPPRAQ
ncbi:MAG: hypothetical protein JST85_04315 [Acidobacteria bacterium]|nr:hypothetical protein [Acidobacteriota bacterium]